MKRTYATAAARNLLVLLDETPLKLASGEVLRFPTHRLAEAVAVEWDAQGERIDPATMPLHRLARTTMEWTEPFRAEALAEIEEYIDGDTLCYRAAEPDELVALQREYWDPILHAATERFDAEWTTTTGIAVAEQSPRVRQALHRYAGSLGAWHLTAFHHLVKRTGSPVLAALIDESLDAEAVFEAAFLEERYQARKWGEDAEAAERRMAIRREIADLERWIGMIY